MLSYINQFTIALFFFVFWGSFVLTPVRSAENSSESTIILLEFTSSGCGACQKIKPFLEEMQRKGYPIEPVLLDDRRNRAVFEKYQVRTMPTFVMLVDGQEVNRLVGQGESITAIRPKLLALFDQVSRSGRAMSAEETPRQLRSNENLLPPLPVLSETIVPAVSSSRSMDDEFPNDPIVNAMTGAMTNAGAMTAQVPVASEQRGVTANSPATVRLRVQNGAIVDRGSGTIIHANRFSTGNEALILTCGHLFRNSQGKGGVEVDLFDPATGREATVIGECIRYDDEVDLAFVGIPLPFDIAPVRIASPDQLPAVGEEVMSIGCDGGENPTTLYHRILSTNRNFFQPKQPGTATPFYYIQVSEAPVGGRSGGGLFRPSAQGLELIGVCNAGDPNDNEGFFVPVSVVYREMMATDCLKFVSNELFHLLPPANLRTGDLSLVQTASPATNQFSSDLVQTTALLVSGTTTEPPQLTMNRQQQLEAGINELKKRFEQGAEIICIVNWNGQTPPTDATGSDIIRIPAR